MNCYCGNDTFIKSRIYTDINYKYDTLTAAHTKVKFCVKCGCVYIDIEKIKEESK